MTKDVMDFVEKSKEAFENDWGMSTHSDSKLGYIALRWGLFDDCIKVYELGREIGFFEQWFEKPTNDDILDFCIKGISSIDYKLTPQQIGRLQDLLKNINKEEL